MSNTKFQPGDLVQLKSGGPIMTAEWEGKVPEQLKKVDGLAQRTKAKPNANTRTLRPDKCLVVSSFSPRLRPGCPRNIAENAATTKRSVSTVSPPIIPSNPPRI